MISIYAIYVSQSNHALIDLLERKDRAILYSLLRK